MRTGLALLAAAIAWLATGSETSGPATTRAVAPSGPADSRCPEALVPGRRAPERALHRTRSRVPELYSRFELDRHGYSIVAVAALDEALTSHPVDRARLTRVARRACGRQVASRSWVAILHFPGAQMASLGPVVLYVARTPGGWRPWYEWTPNFGGRRFIGD